MSTWRRRVAGVMAALYALFLFVPPAAVAASPSGTAVQCLSEVVAAPAQHVHHHDGKPHAHHDGMPGTHDHSDDQGCCGLFGPGVVLPPSTVATTFEHRSSAAVFSVASFAPRGHSPPPADRPPRALLDV